MCLQLYNFTIENIWRNRQVITSYVFNCKVYHGPEVGISVHKKNYTTTFFYGDYTEVGVRISSSFSVLRPFSYVRPFLYFDPPTLLRPKPYFDFFVTTLLRPKLYFDLFGQTLLQSKLYFDLCFSTNKKSRFDKRSK